MSAEPKTLLDLGTTVVRRRPKTGDVKAISGLTWCEVLVNGTPVKCRKLVVTFDLGIPPQVAIEYLDYETEAT